MLMTNQQPAKLSKPGVGALDDPAAFVSSEFAAVLVASEFAVLSVGDDQLDAAFLQPLAQRVGVVGAVGDHPFGLLPGTAFGPGDADFGECGLRKTDFSRRGTFEPNSQWKTLAVDQYHPLRALAPLGFSDRGAPFFAGAKLPSRKASSHFSSPSASSHTSCSSHRFSRRQQVVGDGTSRAGTATPIRSAKSIKCLPNSPGSRPTNAPACRCAASASAAMARSTPTAPRSTTRIASSPSKKLIKPTSSGENKKLEAESTYETCSRHFLLLLPVAESMTVGLLFRHAINSV